VSVPLIVSELLEILGAYLKNGDSTGIIDP
jgi:hypothetical protein